MNDLIGKSLGRYHILEQLGEGGMAIVYKAYDTRLERDVAVKIIRKGAFPADHIERILKRFEREAKALARLSHPNIMKIHDYGEHEGSPYLVMEYLPSGTLKQKMGKPMPWQEAIQLLLPIAEALDYAHSQNMIHRDVKPANILLTERGQPMLTDFGIAKVLDLEETQDLTGTSAALGTPEYMAPEQAIAKTVDHRVDIYSLGVVLYEMVTGRKPFIADTPMAVLIKHATEPLLRPKQFVPNLPDSVEKALLKALAKQPENRYQDMGELTFAFKGILDGKVGREKAKSDTAEKAIRRAALLKTLSNFLIDLKSSLISAKPIFRTLGIVGILIILFWTGSKALPTLLSLMPSTQPVATASSTNITAPSINNNEQVASNSQKFFYFTSNHDGKTEIYALSAKGDAVRLLRTDWKGNSWSPVPDGQGNVYFTSNHDGKTEIYALDAKGNVIRLLRKEWKGDSWSPAPDGQGNVYFTSNPDGKTEIYVLDAKGNVIRLLRTEWKGDSWSPIPDGQGTVYFTSNHDGRAGIYAMDPIGNVVRLLKTDWQDDSWSPIPDNHGNIYFTSNHDDKAEIYALNTEGDVIQLLRTDWKGDSWSPVPDGQGNIYFTSNHNGKNEVFILSIKGDVHLIDNTKPTYESWTGKLSEQYPSH